jgi:hypothetical protein
LHEGQLFPKNQTYSDLLKVDEGVVCIEHIAQSKYSDHPSYQRFRQETYIGIPLFWKVIDMERWGFQMTIPARLPIAKSKLNSST